MRKNQKMFRGLVLGLTIALTLMGCGGGQAGSADQTEKPKEIVKIGVLRIDDSVPFYAAEKEGLFAKYGVEAQIYPFKSSAEQAQAFEAGELDMVMNDMIVQGLMKKSGTDTKVVALAFGAVPEEGRFLIVASPNSGISSPEDLAGAKVAISSNTMMDYLVEQIAELGYFSQKDIETVNMPNLMLRVESLIEGRDIQAAILPDPLASYALLAGCAAVIDDTQLGGVNLSQSVVLASQKMIDERRGDMEKVLEAYYEAMEDINTQPEKYREFCLEMANVPGELSETYPTPKYTPRSLPTKENVSSVVNWLVSRGLVDKPYTYEEMVWLGGE